MFILNRSAWTIDFAKHYLHFKCILKFDLSFQKRKNKEKRKEKWWHENKIYEKAFMNNLQTYIEFQKLSIYISFNKTCFCHLIFPWRKELLFLKVTFQNVHVAINYEVIYVLLTVFVAMYVHLVFVSKTTWHMWGRLIFRSMICNSYLIWQYAILNGY